MLPTIVIKVVIYNNDIINQAIMSLNKNVLVFVCQPLIYLVAFHYFSHSDNCDRRNNRDEVEQQMADQNETSTNSENTTNG